MNSSNKININYSSLMGLKAELLKKQAEVEAAKLRNSTSQKTQEASKPKSKKSQEKDEKVKKLPESEITDLDDLKIHTKSKLMLEAKSRLYHNLKKSHTNANPNYLVDFTNKSDSEEELIEQNCEEKEKSESELDFNDDDDDWIEYIDCFGRTRKCLKEDLTAMKEKDRLLSQKVLRNPDVAENENNDVLSKPNSPPREPELEKMRKKWEAQMEKLAGKTDIHYQDILFDEARSHGVGYYAFSQDEEERKKQQETLTKLRKDTEEKQRQAREAREKKLLMERNRLKAAKVRQKIRAGLSGELTEEEIAEIDAKYNLIENTNIRNNVDKEVEEKTENEDEKETKKNSLASIEDKINAFGELLGKRNKWYTMSQEEWVEKRRKLREEEFAPVYDNFVKFEETNANTKDESMEEEEDVIGPLPPADLTEESNKTIDDNKAESNKKANLDGDQILVGLKYLRAKFEEEQKTN